jgi:hypothetical protein
MMKLARTIRFDESDGNIFIRAAEPDEWAISGAFEFSNWTEEDLTGKKRQAFANGWLGLESFGRSTFVAVAAIEPHEYEDLIQRLAAHFMIAYGAPDLASARPAAEEELLFMRGLCEDHNANDLLIVERELVDAGVKESFRKIATDEASIDLVAMHGSLD